MSELTALKTSLRADPVECGNLADILGTEKTIRHESCDKHGSYESRNVFRQIWSGCPICAAEEKAAREREEVEQEVIRRHAAWLRRLGEAGIPERFRDRTIDSYKATTEGQKRALEFVKFYVEQFAKVSETGRSAIFCGKPGTGKTHLSVGVALAIMATGKSALFTTVQRMVRRVKETYRKDSDESERDVLNMLTYPDLLIIDEIGVQFGSEFEKNLMFEILNERYENRKPTLLLSNLTAQEVRSFLGERIYDRLREDGGQCVSFDWSSYRGSAA